MTNLKKIFLGATAIAFILWGIKAIASDPNFLFSRKEFLSHTPPSIHSCLVDAKAGGKLWAQAKQGEQFYYLVGVARSKDQYYETIIRLDSNGCLILIPKDESGFYPLSNYLDKTIARTLARGRVREFMELLGGREALQRYYEEQAADSSLETYITTDDAWALQREGVKIPNSKNIFIVGSEGVPLERQNRNF
jgi:hypothetical protein